MATLFTKLLFALRRMPGVGPRTAERIAFHLLDLKDEDFSFLIDTLRAYREKTKSCPVCGLISEQSPCRICADPARDGRLLCVVKDVHDAYQVEKSRAFKGKYHVLGGLVSPLDTVREEDLSIGRLAERVRAGVDEILFAFEQSVESAVTIKAVTRRLAEFTALRFSRLATGIPTGAGLEHIDAETLKTAVLRRTPLD